MAALGDASTPGVNGLIQQFTSITGATESVGKHMLEACNNNLEMAVTMFLDGGGIAEEPSTSSSSAGASSSKAPPADDEVRAPIPQKQDILVEPEPMFGAPKRRRPARSIFDGFRDFQTETIRQEQELRNGSAADKKLSTLADLFRPPVELMHKGSFETAKDCGQLENKWLMINIQNVQDFACQCLNRDVWSNDAVRTIIREHFIFWQVYHDSEEGQRYIQFYKLNKFPYISILDPRTGQKMVEWNQLDVASFLEQVTGFLTEHGQLDGPASSHPPPAKRARSESLIDASEDSQLEAAIRASLQETHYESSSAPDLPDSPHSADADSDGDSESEPFSDSEGLISVDGSATRQQNPGKAAPTPWADTPLQDQPLPLLQPQHPSPRHVQTVPPPVTGSPPTKRTATEKRRAKKNHLEPPAAAQARSQADPDSEHCSGENHRTSAGQSSRSVKTETSDLDCLDDNGPKARLMLRYPDGQREQIALSFKAKLMALVRHVQSKGYPNERFELVTNFPRRKLAHLDYDITLQEAGLCPQETVFVQERN
ncbi:LOW QUALITY PROTEIN: UBX domain-containing protein 7 [Salmo salar]|uniref:LOW QUALITY PROTEIN: UBX domain-containing protein 7 n=1 Tax=Salmo salar TaxID=8030 RepID=A0A1S3LVX5_SALSA|nr:LOW QUALITY PROTEIN: UBX domain-containing protein 7 [Salmo salar]